MMSSGAPGGAPDGRSKAASAAFFTFCAPQTLDMGYWLMKSEPDEVSIDDLAAAPGRKLPWFGVRNYQARNFMRDQMKVGDLAFFYHSSCPKPGIAGICKIASAAYPDATQFERGSPYFDAASEPDNPRWLNVDVRFVRKTRLLGLDEMRSRAELADMLVLKRGNRLSITPVSAAHWVAIEELLAGPSAR
jgi:predicted RNA-binding protein with PUA-like domain